MEEKYEKNTIIREEQTDILKLADAICGQVAAGRVEIFEQDTVDSNWYVKCVRDDSFRLENKRGSSIEIKLKESTESFLYATTETETEDSNAGRSSILVRKSNSLVMDRSIITSLDMINLIEECIDSINLIKNEGLVDAEKLLYMLKNMKIYENQPLRIRCSQSEVYELKSIERFKQGAYKEIAIPTDILDIETSSKLEYIRKINQCCGSLSNFTGYDIYNFKPYYDVLSAKREDLIHEMVDKYGEDVIEDMVYDLSGIYDNNFLDVFYAISGEIVSGI